MKRALNAADRYRERFEDNRAKIAKAGKVIRDADQHAEENAAKIAELSSRLAEAEKALVSAERLGLLLEVSMVRVRPVFALN